MMPDIRFDALTETTATLNTDRFQGRIAYDTTLNRWVVCYDGTNWAVHARRDVAETFASSVTLAGGNLNVAAGALQTAGVPRISSAGAGTLTTLSTTGLATLAQATVSDIAADCVVSTTTAGRLQGDAGFTVTRTSGVTRVLTLGDNAVAGNVAINLKRTATYFAALQWLNSDGATRWGLSMDGTLNIALEARDAGTVLIDKPVDIVNASAGLITIGGSTNRTTNFTGAIQTSGVTRISSAGAGTLTTLSTTGLATLAQAAVSDITPTRVMYAGTAGRVTGSANLAFDDTASVLSVGSTALAGNPRLSIDSAAGQTRYIRVRTGTGARWAFGGGLQAESGSDTGTDFEILAVNDAGTASTVLSIVRAAGGVATWNRPLNLSTLTASRMLSLDASKNIVSLDAAGSRALIGAAATTDLASYQPLDSDLTAIAALATTTFGRSLLTQADAAAARSVLGAASSAGSVTYEPLFTGRRTVAVTNGVLATLIPSYTVAANGWTVGMRRVFEFNLFSTCDGQVEVRLGTNTVASFALGGTARVAFRVEVVCLSTGASGRFAYSAFAADAGTGSPTGQTTVIGDSQAYVDGVGDNWSVDTTASTSIAFEYTPSAGSGNVVVHSGSAQTFTP